MEFAEDAEKLEMINATLEMCTALRGIALRLEECGRHVQTHPVERMALETIGRAYELAATRAIDINDTVHSIAHLLGV